MVSAIGANQIHSINDMMAARARMLRDATQLGEGAMGAGAMGAGAMSAGAMGTLGPLSRAPITGASSPAGSAEPGALGAFGPMMQQALRQVNGLQVQAEQLSNAYLRGETHDIAAVMVARQKASLGFEATLQIRNKLVSAYQDIMNMPV